MSKSPAFQWYPGDCDTDENVRGMDDAEFGFYVRCLNHAWLNDGLPSEISEFARIMGKTPKQFLKLWARVSKCFFLENTTKRFKNSRQEAQRSQQESFKKLRVDAAKSRWLNTATMHVHDLADANGVHVQCSSSSSLSSTSTKKELTNVSSKETAAPAAAKATRFDDRPLTEEWAQWPMSKHGWSREQTEIAYGAFSNYFANGKGKGQTAKDWRRSWQVWCGNERNVPRQQALVPYESNTDRAIKRAYELHEQGLL